MKHLHPLAAIILALAALLYVITEQGILPIPKKDAVVQTPQQEKGDPLEKVVDNVIEEIQHPRHPRFQLIQLGEARRDQFLLDTTTGMTWTSVCDPEDGKTDPLNPAQCPGTMYWQLRKKNPE